ncbi:MAG: biotin/lipoyl-binding protein, partial [Verrucomicrobiota bacterium]
MQNLFDSSQAQQLPAAPVADTRPLRTEDLDFARNARDAMISNRVRGANALLWLIALVIAGFVLWAMHAEIDEVTKGQGKVIPSTSVQTVQNLEGGIIAEILVTEGDRVQAGDVLVRIDDTMSNASYQENLAQAEAYRAALVRLDAEAKGKPIIEFPSEISEKRPDLIDRETALFSKRLKEVAEQRKTLENSLRPKCESRYVGRTEQRLQDRIRQHVP